MPLSAESNWFQLTSASLLWVYGNDSTHELWYGICASITCQHVALLNLGISCVETSTSSIKIPLWFDKSIGQSYQEPCQIYQNQKNMVQWANEEKTVPAGFGVSFSGKDAKCNKIISSLTEPWKPIRPKKKKQFTPGPPRRKRGESKFAGAKATAHPAQANALDKLHQHQHHQHHHHHQQFQKGKHAPKCRPKRKKPPPVPKSQANPNLRPKTNSVPCPGECS